jgi:MPBQ/MSBQ methyltransferase
MINNEGLLHWYDRWMRLPVYDELYEHSGYFNFGYWEAGIETQLQACENLMERLMSFLPERGGRLVDMACGMGATTAYFQQHYPEMLVIGINLSQKQLHLANKAHPGILFTLMDAAYPALADDSAEVVMCIEAAFHFHTRQQFLAEAYRILKPGGVLVLADIFFNRLPGNHRPFVPRQNFVRDEAAYRQEFQDVGFDRVETMDATQACWRGHIQYTQRWAWRRFRSRRISLVNYLRMMVMPMVGPLLVRRYLLAAAYKASSIENTA